MSIIADSSTTWEGHWFRPALLIARRSATYKEPKMDHQKWPFFVTDFCDISQEI